MAAKLSKQDISDKPVMQQDEVCEIVCYDLEKIQSLQGRVDEPEVQDMAKIFKALSDPTRMKMATYLDLGDELCVCDVAFLTGQSIATTSHHLRLMKTLGIAKSRKEGKNVFYSLMDHHIRTLIRMTQEHMREEHCDDRHNI